LEPPNHLLARQVAHNRESAGNWEHYAEHRARITRLSLGLLNATRGANARVCVLGAGNCNDLELSELTKHCRELHLIDFDSEALIRGLHTQRLTGGREAVVDVPGGARVTLQGGVDLTGIAFDLWLCNSNRKPRTKPARVGWSDPRSRWSVRRSRLHHVAHSTNLISGGRLGQ
jgi:hypothetical protein